MLTRACRIFYQFCVTGIEPNEARLREHVEGATATVTSLVERLGYTKATEVAEQAQTERKTIKQVVLEQGLLTEEEFAALVAPENVTRLGSPDAEGFGL